MAEHSQARTAVGRPQSTDELAAMPDKPATEEMPQEVATALATQRVYIHLSLIHI